jgi:thioredoxin 2
MSDASASNPTVQTVCAACGAVNRLPRARLAQNPAAAKCGKCGGRLMDPHPAALSEARFDDFVGKSDIPVLVDFWAPWCGPCRAMAPALERAAETLSPQVRVVKVNIDEAPALASRLRVSAVPTLAVFSRGRELARTSGALSESALTDWARRAAAGG